MVQAQIQGEVYFVPNSIQDVTIERFIEYRNISDHNDQLSILKWALGSLPTFKKTDTIEQELANVFAHAECAIQEMYSFMASADKLDLPPSIDLLDRKIMITKGLIKTLPYWGYVQCKSAIAKHIESQDPTDEIPNVLAHYLYTLATGEEYNEKKADDFVSVINQMDMRQAVQLGGFFLRKQMGLSKQKKKSFLAR